MPRLALSLQKGEADALSLDGGFIYIAGKCGLVPVLAENQSKWGRVPPVGSARAVGWGHGGVAPTAGPGGMTLRRMDALKRESVSPDNAHNGFLSFTVVYSRRCFNSNGRAQHRGQAALKTCPCTGTAQKSIVISGWNRLYGKNATNTAELPSTRNSLVSIF